MVENARSVAAARYDLFIQYNGQAASNAPISRLMAGAGIKVLAIQVPVPGAPLFAVDNSASGRVLAEEGKRRWPDAVPVAVIIGLPEAGPMFRDRGEAAKRAPRRCWRPAPSPRAMAASRPWRAWTSPSAPARCTPSWARTGPASLTLTKVLSGVVAPDGGEVLLEGRPAVRAATTR